ncbi:MAG TPA: hypothetical protein VG820_12695 [Fimbriimonadaceae bacterium]|nr:hypothetical protein [Fimbriimonadaceae bacterium]
MFYAAFPDTVQAERMVRHLLEDGIELDDISLVVPNETDIESSAPASVGDASYFVGRSDDPTHDLVDERTPDADYEAAEVSPVGGGISTSDEGQNVEMIDEMDESQSVAEDDGWPRDDTSHSRHELDDLDLAVMTGFPTPVTPLDNDFATGPSDEDRSLDAVRVPGLGLIIGGGDLATAAFDWAGKDGNPDASALLTYLQDEGVPPGTANELLAQFGNGSALLAVALVAETDEDALEEVAEKYGAVTTGWFGSPRY